MNIDTSEFKVNESKQKWSVILGLLGLMQTISVFIQKSNYELLYVAFAFSGFYYYWISVNRLYTLNRENYAVDRNGVRYFSWVAEGDKLDPTPSKQVILSFARPCEKPRSCECTGLPDWTDRAILHLSIYVISAIQT